MPLHVWPSTIVYLMQYHKTPSLTLTHVHIVDQSITSICQQFTPRRPYITYTYIETSRISVPPYRREVVMRTDMLNKLDGSLIPDAEITGVP